MTLQELTQKIDTLRRAVRSGDFGQSSIVKEVWQNRHLVKADSFYRLAIHTLVWEVLDSRGEYLEASKHLRADQIVEDGRGLIYQQVANIDEFILSQFPASLDSNTKRERYNLWRQRTMGSMALSFAAYRLQEGGDKDHLMIVRMFIEQALGRAGFPCNGSRARLHYFLAQMDLSNEEAIADYELSLRYCIQRVNERLTATASQCQQETERAFAIYCLGKLKLLRAHLAFDQGHIQEAKANAREAGLLLKVSRDPFLPETAALLVCRIERHESTLFNQGEGLALLERIRNVRKHLRGHSPLHLEAWLEETIIHGYLKSKPDSNAARARELTLKRAVTEFTAICIEAKKLRNHAIQIESLLAKARTLARLELWDHAFLVTQKARLFSQKAQLKSAEAKVLFVEGRTYAAQERLTRGTGKSHELLTLALEKFGAALALQHPSKTFVVACKERIVETLLKLDRALEAEQVLDSTNEHVHYVEDTFLKVRLQDLRTQIDSNWYSCQHFSADFDVEQAKAELEKKYLLNLQRRTQVTLMELKGRWSEFEQQLLPLTYDKLRSLLKKHPYAEKFLPHLKQ